MNPLDQSPVVKGLLHEIDQAVTAADSSSICQHVKQVLKRTFDQHHDFLPESFLRPVEDGYARHLLHRDPHKRYSIVMMVWDRGQGTPIHDHDGHWCVECVYRGQIEVVSYDLAEECDDDRVRFVEQSRVVSSTGGAGALIPPHEYHTIRNRFEQPAVTMHVYEGEIESCQVFELTNEDGIYLRKRHELSYS